MKGFVMTFSIAEVDTFSQAELDTCATIIANYIDIYESNVQSSLKASLSWLT